jgi:WD40 repeat protein
VATRELLHTLKGHFNRVVKITFSPNGKQLAVMQTSGTYPTVKVWDTATGALLYNLSPTGWASEVTFSLDGKQLAFFDLSFSVEHDALKIWDTPTAGLLYTLKGEGLALSPDGKLMASLVNSETIHKTVQLWDTATGALRHTLNGHSGQVRGAAFSQVGKQLASRSLDKTVMLWGTAK